MRGYFKVNIKFLAALLLALAIYVSYLFFFRAQVPDPFRLRENCTEEERIAGTAKANVFFEEYFDEQLVQNPEWESRLGIKDNYDKWTSMTEDYYKAKHQSNQAFYTYLNDSIILCECLDEAAQLSAKLLKGKLALAIEKYDYRYYSYPVNQMHGVHTKIANMLINAQKIDNEQDAKAYITRVNSVPQKIDELIEQLKLRAARNIILPKFLFPKVLEAIEHIIVGEQFL